MRTIPNTYLFVNKNSLKGLIWRRCRVSLIVYNLWFKIFDAIALKLKLSFTVNEKERVKIKATTKNRYFSRFWIHQFSHWIWHEILIKLNLAIAIHTGHFYSRTEESTEITGTLLTVPPWRSLSQVIVLPKVTRHHELGPFHYCVHWIGVLR